MPIAKCQVRFYRFAVPRASFFTLLFFDPRAYSRGFNGFSALRFLRAVRFSFLRSSLLNAAVFAMSAIGSFGQIFCRPYETRPFVVRLPSAEALAIIGCPSGAFASPERGVQVCSKPIPGRSERLEKSYGLRAKN